MIFEALDPQRDPDWRWQWARDSETMPQISKCNKVAKNGTRIDPYIKLAIETRRFERREDSSFSNYLMKGSAFRGKLPPVLNSSVDIRDLKEAISLSSSLNFARYWFLKSLILGQAPIPLISHLTQRSSNFINIHNAVLFDVCNRLDDVPFIWKKVIGTDPTKGLEDNDIQSLWLECAYLAGYRRFLFLHAPVMKVPLTYQQLDYHAYRPTLEVYLTSGLACENILSVIRKRMLPDATRSIADLRQLYQTLLFYLEPQQGEQTQLASTPLLTLQS